jgi:WD40 repeat protein
MDQHAHYSSKNPFPGIRSFEPEEHHLFFGREDQIGVLASLLMEHRLIVVTGASGSGKSSLVKAGLIPFVLDKNLEPEGNAWGMVRIRPGNAPLRNLAIALQSFAALGAYKGMQGWTLAQLEGTLKASPDGLASLYGRLRQASSQRHLVVIDQFEELFRYSQTGEEIHTEESLHFINLLLGVANASGLQVHVVITMQSDFLDNCARFPEFTAAINKASYLVPHMRPDQIRKAIQEPILANHAQISDALLQRLEADIQGRHGELLPILQHAMLRTWDYWEQGGGRQSGPIDVPHYEAVGTLAHAISKHANEIYDSLPRHEDKIVAERVFKSLVQASSDGRPSRRPTMLREISIIANTKEERVVEVLEVFRHASCGFLMPSPAVILTPDTTIDIAHESIIQAWDKLAVWVKEEVQSAQLYLRLSHTARLYQEGRSGLWVNPELELGLLWLAQQQPNPTWALRYDDGYERAMEFLQFSKREHEHKVAEREEQQRRALARANKSVVVLGTAAVISIIFLIISLNLRFQAEQAEKVAREKEVEAVWQRNQAEVQRKEAVLQTKISEQQQLIAEQQRIIAEEQKLFAISQQRYAQEQQRVAEEQRHLAEQQKSEAVLQRQKAVVASEEAERQRSTAEVQRNLAEEKRQEAVAERRRAERLRMLALSRAVATQALKAGGAGNPELPVQLAIFAWQLNQQHAGHEKDADIFTALSDLGDDKPAFRGHKDAVRALALDPSNPNRFLSAGDDGFVRVWNAADPGAHEHFMMGKNGKNGLRALALSPDGRFAVAGGFNGNLLLWNQTGQLPTLWPSGHEGPISQLHFLDGDRLLSLGTDGRLFVHQFNDDGKPRKSYSAESEHWVAVSPVPGQKAFVALAGSGKVWKMSEGKDPELLYEFVPPVMMRSLAVSHDAKQWAVGCQDGRIYVAPFGQPDAGQWLIGHASAITCIDFNPKDQAIASGSFDGTVRIWDLLNTKARPLILRMHDGWVYHLKYTLSGQELISGGQDRLLYKVVVDADAIAQKLCGQLQEHEIADESWDKFIGPDIPKTRICEEQAAGS